MNNLPRLTMSDMYRWQAKTGNQPQWRESVDEIPDLQYTPGNDGDIRLVEEINNTVFFLDGEWFFLPMMSNSLETRVARLESELAELKKRLG